MMVASFVTKAPILELNKFVFSVDLKIGFFIVIKKEPKKSLYW